MRIHVGVPQANSRPTEKSALKPSFDVLIIPANGKFVYQINGVSPIGSHFLLTAMIR